MAFWWLPDGLMIEHRFVISEGNEALAQRTVMGMAGTGTRLEVVRIFSRSDATSRGYRCTETLSRGESAPQKRPKEDDRHAGDRYRLAESVENGTHGNICALLLAVCRMTASAQPVEALPSGYLSFGRRHSLWKSPLLPARPSSILA